MFSFSFFSFMQFSLPPLSPLSLSHSSLGFSMIFVDISFFPSAVRGFRKIFCEKSWTVKFWEKKYYQLARVREIPLVIRVDTLKWFSNWEPASASWLAGHYVNRWKRRKSERKEDNIAVLIKYVSSFSGADRLPFSLPFALSLSSHSV